MNIDGMISSGNSIPRFSDSSVKVDSARKIKDDSDDNPQVEKNPVPPEELLKQIKTLTEDGLYSVRFEKDDPASRLIVKIVDKQTSEVIRQLPAEELLNVLAALDKFRGNIVNTSS
ncbi:MAG: flagellar protein FlaG [Deltaproteobacteria bacterium]|nr:flagellar protein FlaG [Deltaproteobacteria bacterium]MBW2659125.1 flagellar protein FlaG [Deltaproteobacteria bacterium]